MTLPLIAAAASQVLQGLRAVGGPGTGNAWGAGPPTAASQTPAETTGGAVGSGAVTPLGNAAAKAFGTLQSLLLQVQSSGTSGSSATTGASTGATPENHATTAGGDAGAATQPPGPLHSGHHLRSSGGTAAADAIGSVQDRVARALQAYAGANVATAPAGTSLRV